MSGLVKQKEYNWKDTNLAYYSSARNVKKESAQLEPAWEGAGQEVGLQIWRIVKFQVQAWPKEDYGRFYDGDSYIILNTYKEDGRQALLYDVHFWIGKYSTQDEYVTAAYKTVELDTLLDDVPIQHREVQGNESQLFRSYFKTMELMRGGAESGFFHVTPTSYEPRLLHLHGDRYGVRVNEIRKSEDLLDNTDVYILDLGLRLLQWNGSGSNKDERYKAALYIREIAEKRLGKPKTEVFDEGMFDRDFKQYLNEVADQEINYSAADQTKQLFRLSDESGKMTFSLEKAGSIVKDDFDTKDVFILDVKFELFVWIGKLSSDNEKQNAMVYAHTYLQSTDHPLVPVSCLKEGSQVKAFETAVAA